jgi:hypothetical protein
MRANLSRLFGEGDDGALAIVTVTISRHFRIADIFRWCAELAARSAARPTATSWRRTRSSAFGGPGAHGIEHAGRQYAMPVISVSR